MASVAPATISQLRRLVNEPYTESDYSDADLRAYVERYPLTDANGNEPDERDWAGAWDLWAAASDVWLEKAAMVAQDYTFVADGVVYTRSQVYDQYKAQARFCASRRTLATHTARSYPKEYGYQWQWIVNYPEPDLP